MKRDANFEDAKRLYLEQYGDPMVTNTYLKIALVLVSLVAAGLALAAGFGLVAASDIALSRNLLKRALSTARRRSFD